MEQGIPPEGRMFLIRVFSQVMGRGNHKTSQAAEHDVSKHLMLCSTDNLNNIRFVQAAISCYFVTEPGHINEDCWCFNQLIFKYLRNIFFSMSKISKS